jgi:hypothetical protein
MSSRAGTYDLITDFGVPSDDGYVSTDPYWIIAVFRLGVPVSFSRKLNASNHSVTDGALLRTEKPLVITDDCIQIQVSNSKTSHIKQMTAVLKQTTVNYLVEILPGDYVMGWIMNNRTTYETVISKLDKLDPEDPCNFFQSGLKFVGRIDDVNKNIAVDPQSGTKNTGYSIKCSGFQELDTQLFYDYALASSDVMKQDIGTYLARLGQSINKIFGQQTKGQIERDNVNRIIPELVDLIVGKGPDRSKVIHVRNADGTSQSNMPSADNDAPYAYLVPLSVGHALGRDKSDDDKIAGVMSYADIMEMSIGVETYSVKSGPHTFTPDYDPNHPEGTANRRYGSQPLMGTFLPMMPDFANRPLWAVFQQYLNPSINEMYTALKLNADGLIVPTVTMRQIPFTTDAFVKPADPKPRGSWVDRDAGEEGPMTAGQYLMQNEKETVVHTTKFLDLPRWHIPATLVRSVSIGRSNATRVNFVHVYGQSAYLSDHNVPIQAQMIRNPPVRDDLDIMRSGLRPYMMTVECWVNDQVGKVGGAWIALIADWTMGSHLTLNGHIEMFGIQSPIAEGDNVQFDGVVYHVMNVSHAASINTQTGTKQWSTNLQVCNGMRAVEVGTATVQPLYPGLSKLDNTAFDPGLTAEHRPTTGGDSPISSNWDDPEAAHFRKTKSQLADEEAVAKQNQGLTGEQTDAAGQHGPSKDVGRR